MAKDGTFVGEGVHDPRYRALLSQLIDARQKRGLSQRAFAAIIGRRQQFVHKYETGERRLDIIEFADIARLLGIDPAASVAGII